MIRIKCSDKFFLYAGQIWIGYNFVFLRVRKEGTGGFASQEYCKKASYKSTRIAARF